MTAAKGAKIRSERRGAIARAAVRDVVHVYRAAQRLRADAFAKEAFAWLADRVASDRAVIVTSLRGASWVDAHFCGVSEPRALMESHDRVRHLDPLAKRILEQPNVVQRSGHDDPEIRSARYAPFRDHLRRHDGRYALAIAVPNDEQETLSVLMAIRGWGGLPDFDARDEEVFDAIAPHLVEAFAVNRTTFLGGPGAPSASPPIASIDGEGRFIGTTPAFVRIFWPEEPPGTAYLPAEVLRRLRRGLPWPLPGGRHTLHAYEEGSGGYLLRLRSTSPADGLTARERQVATHFARGSTYKAIATELSLAPTTVRNHLQNLYAKLGVTQRDELAALLSRP